VIDRRVGVYAGLAALAVAYRIPPLLNARSIHSDAAVVALQAQHMLRGEFSWFVWGAGYQSSFDAVAVAAAFALFGVSALAVMIVSLLGHLGLMGFAFATLTRRLDVARASLCVLPLVFAPEAVNGVALAPPRQWSITAVMAAVWLVDRASGDGGSPRRFGIAAFVAVMPLCLDAYALQFMVAMGLLGLASLWDEAPQRSEWTHRARAAALGLGSGAVVVWVYRHLPGHASAQSPLSFRNVASNAALLWNQCLPWLLGAKTFVPGSGLLPTPWEPPLPVRMFQGLGAASFALAILAAGIGSFRKGPWPLRRLALFAAAASASALAGFLLSSKPTDMWGARYLAPIIWTSPFALAFLAQRIELKRFALGLSPYVLTAALGSWLSFGPFVRGALPVRSARGAAQEEMAVAGALRARGIRFAAAQYWLAYRLTFLWDENPTVVPLDPAEDRYTPYRQGFDQARDVAYVFHPFEQRARAEDTERALAEAKVPFERLEVAGFTVLVAHRARD